MHSTQVEIETPFSEIRKSESGSDRFAAHRFAGSTTYTNLQPPTIDPGKIKNFDLDPTNLITRKVRERTKSPDITYIYSITYIFLKVQAKIFL